MPGHHHHLMGFGTTFAEPALIAVAGKAAELAVIDPSSGNREAMLQSSHSHCGSLWPSLLNRAGGRRDANHSGLAAPFFHHGRFRAGDAADAVCSEYDYWSGL